MSQSRPNLKTIFLEALNCSDGADRAAYLEKVCGRASTIRSRIDALLLAHDAAGGFDEATSGSEATPTRHIDRERATTGGSPPSVTRARDATSTFDADETSAPLSLRPIRISEDPYPSLSHWQNRRYVYSRMHFIGAGRRER
jgi:hypothetical protein